MTFSHPFGRCRKLNKEPSFSLSESTLTGLPVSNDEDDDSDNPDGPLGLHTLNIPLEPLVELVFVHGLGGGSRKSWSKSCADDHFWPKIWLPKLPGFQNVRIHSFGYKSAKTEMNSTVANIPILADSLLSAIRDSPILRGCRNPIILLGHSMGGLVVKQAYVQAKSNTVHPEMGQRIRALYFLGTPRRGADITQLLRACLKVTPIVEITECVVDLDPSSRLLQSINQEFPKYADEVELRSYYETEQTNIIGLKSQIMVPMHSALLHHPGEKSDYMNANHRNMCKFERPTDPNFVKLRNALSSTVESIIHKVSSDQEGELAEKVSLLRTYLNVRDLPGDDLQDYEEMCLLPDSCSWFTAGDQFRRWRDTGSRSKVGEPENMLVSKIFLVIAEPGAGKSVLASQVINNLESLNLECSYYFFNTQDSKYSASAALRSIAYQMALLYPDVRNAILDLKRDGVNLENENDRTLWPKVFANCIFRCRIERQQYWVLDGLD